MQHENTLDNPELNSLFSALNQAIQRLDRITERLSESPYEHAWLWSIVEARRLEIEPLLSSIQ